jgi:hypothetical protein
VGYMPQLWRASTSVAPIDRAYSPVRYDQYSPAPLARLLL